MKRCYKKKKIVWYLCFGARTYVFACVTVRRSLKRVLEIIGTQHVEVCRRLRINKTRELTKRVRGSLTVSDNWDLIVATRMEQRWKTVISFLEGEREAATRRLPPGIPCSCHRRIEICYLMLITLARAPVCTQAHELRITSRTLVHNA